MLCMYNVLMKIIKKYNISNTITIVYPVIQYCNFRISK